MQDKVKAFLKEKKTVWVTALFMLLFLAALVVFALAQSGRQAAPAPASDAAASAPTADPYAVMASLWGDWTQDSETPSGILSLSLHGDNTAVYTVQSVFDAEPRSVNTRWQAQEGLLSIVTDGAEVTQFDFTLEDEVLTLTDGYGRSVRFVRPAPAADAP